MKQLLLTAILLLGFAVPACAQEQATTPDEDKHGASMPFVIDINGDDEDAAKKKDLEERLEKKIESFVEGLFSDSAESMTPEERRALVEDLKELKKLDGGGHGNSDRFPMGGIFLGGLAITLIFGTPIMIVAGILYASYRKRKLIHDTINSYVASGKEIPPEVFASFQQEAGPKTPRTNLHKGLIMVGIGLGIIVCFMVIDAPEAAAIGAIPLFIGLAQLLIWKLESNGNGSKGGN
ncbi:MAG: hypothetical protein HYY48_01120 [Gammaproteobacteria bacterium]|nr:hypothetical protein [Gammaproteobacteria bacterium]